MIRVIVGACAALVLQAAAVAQQTARVFLDPVGAGEFEDRPAASLAYSNPVLTQSGRLYIYVSYGQAGQKLESWRIDLAVRGPATITGWSIYNHVLPGAGAARWTSVNQGVLAADGKRVNGIEMLGQVSPFGASNNASVVAADTMHFRPGTAADPFGTTLLGYVDVQHGGGEGTAAVRIELDGTAATGGITFRAGVRGSDTVRMGWGDAAIAANTVDGTTAWGEAVVNAPVVRPPTVVVNNFAGHPASTFLGADPGERYAAIDQVRPSPNGALAILNANTSAPGNLNNVLVKGALLPRPRLSLLIREGTPTPFDGSITWGVIDGLPGINDAGQAAFSADTSAAATQDEVLMRWSGGAFEVMLREGWQAPDQPPGVLIGGTIDTAAIEADGSVFCRVPTHGGSALQALYRLTGPGAGTALSQTDAAAPAGQMVLPEQSIDVFGTASLAPLGGAYIWAGDLNGPTNTDGVVALGNVVRVQEGRPVLDGSVAGNFVGPVGRPSIAADGSSWVYRGTNGAGNFWVARGDDAGATDRIIAAVGRPIVPESMEVFAANSFVLGVAGRAGRFVLSGATSNPVAAAARVVTFNGRSVLLRTLDQVDLNADGLLNDGVHVVVLLSEAGVITDDGRFYMNVTLRNDSGVSLGTAVLMMNVPDVLHHNGPLVTEQGVGANGADVSREADAPGSLLGLGASVGGAGRVADNFTVPANARWTLRTLTLYAFKEGTAAGDPPVSPITGATLRIWNGPPGSPTASVVFGDTTTNRMMSTGFSGAYKVKNGAPDSDSFRPIMFVNVELPDVELTEGMYWLDWGISSNPPGGATQPFVVNHGQPGKTGGNALWSANSGASFNGFATPQDLPFTLRGESEVIEIDDTEPNDSKGEATAAEMKLNNGPPIRGTAGPGDADCFRIQTPPVAGVWRHTLRLRSAVARHDMTLRGTLASVPWTDVQIQSRRIDGDDLVVEWYSTPGPAPVMYVRVAGTAHTTAPYELTLASAPVAIASAGAPMRGPNVLITSVGQGHGTDTELQVYDQGLWPTVGYNNDDRFDPPSFQSHLLRQYGPAGHHVAIGHYPLVTGVPNYSSDDLVPSDVVTDVPNVAVAGSSLATGDVSFRFGTSGESRAIAAAVDEPFDIVWVRFDVQPSLACNAADIASAGGGDPNAGPDGFLTGDDFDLFIQAFFGESRNHAGVLIADLDDGGGSGSPDGFLTGADFDRFIFLFFGGCS